VEKPVLSLEQKAEGATDGEIEDRDYGKLICTG